MIDTQEERRTKLPTDYQDEILPEGQSVPTYNILQNDSALYSNVKIVKAYTPKQIGSKFGAVDINQTNGRVNDIEGTMNSTNATSSERMSDMEKEIATLKTQMASAQTQLSDMINKIYPVGSIVILHVNTNPGTLFGVGHWERIDGRFIVGKSVSSGNKYNVDVGGTGGSNYIQLRAIMGAVASRIDFVGYQATPTVSGHSKATYAIGGSVVGEGAKTFNHATMVTDINGSEDIATVPPYVVENIWRRYA